LKDIPSITWEKESSGKRIKIFKRREYIHELSQLLGQELDLDGDRIEDLIHSKASFYSQVPFVIKEEISEKEYYHLKMLAGNWPGIHMRSVPKRYYPKGRTAADIIGYMGAINRQEYEKILHEMKNLEQFISERENGEENEFPLGIQSTNQARTRLRDLQEKAYTIHDYVGKTGIEGAFEEVLRGFYGKMNYYSDSKGNFLWKLPGSRPSLEGQRVLLTISSELQEYAEQLLAQNENFRVVRKSTIGPIKKTILAQKTPWIKGGAIIAMEPQTGEVLALASYPRFDPNDFIASNRKEIQKTKSARINRWFENENHLIQLWNLQQPLEREHFDLQKGGFYEEKCWLTWSNYLNFALLKESQNRTTMNRIKTLQQAIDLQNQVDALVIFFPDHHLYDILNALYESDDHIPYRLDRRSKEEVIEIRHIYVEEISKIKTRLDSYFFDLPQNYDKVLIVDLCRLAVYHEAFDHELTEKVGHYSLENHRKAEGAWVKIRSVAKEMSKEIFHSHDFKNWRKEEEKAFLKQKRLEEKAAKAYSKPYLDYFDQLESRQFNDFWEQYQWHILALFLMGESTPRSMKEDLQFNPELTPYIAYFSNWNLEIQGGAHHDLEWKESYRMIQKALQKLPDETALAYLHTLRSYEDLNRPLLGIYRGLRNEKTPTEKDLATIFYPVYGYGYGRSHGYRQSTIQGSLFKIVTAYEALVQRYKKLENSPHLESNLNPLIISDQEFMSGKNRFMGYTEEGKPIPQIYKNGRLPRSLAHRNPGRMDLIRALEVSSNPYFSILAGDHLENPGDLKQAAEKFGFGSRTGINLPGEIAGKLPNDIKENRTGLYSMAIGQHSLVVTPLQTAVMLAAIANHGKIVTPKIVRLTAGKQPMPTNSEIPLLPSFPYQESLSLVGIDFPLFTATFANNRKNFIKEVPTEIKKKLFMPEKVRKILLKGLHAAVQRTCQESLLSLQKLYKEHPDAIKELTSLKNQLLGKTSTSESVERIDLDLKEGTNIYTHVWFGCISCDQTEMEGNKSKFIFRDEFGKPELIVVVYLRYGGYGKEAAPVAAQIVKKWREIKQKHL